jgi:hypothetical protein
LTTGTTPRGEEARAAPKSVSMSNQAVWEAYPPVKATHGAAGSEGEASTELEEQVKDQLDKLWNR